jgi:immune inhibitor A
VRRYGSNDCDVDGDIQIGVAGSADSIVCSNTWFLIRDAMAFWVKSQLDSGKTMAQINQYLSTFDVWDRYDINGNGKFNEPDGVIDHFQIVHAGGDEAAGDPIYGQDAIWSHRWQAQISGTAGCPFDGAGVRSTRIGMGGVSSGVTIPQNLTNFCVFDYTIQPQNGGLGVFAHEYGHDLGLPDLYDTSGNTGGAENSTGFWTLMSSGANIGDGGRDGIGDDPTDLGAWEKFQLGWLNFDVAAAGATSTHRLGPAEYNTQDAPALFVVPPAEAGGDRPRRSVRGARLLLLRGG